LPESKLFEILRPLGFGKSRARELKKISKKLKVDFGSVTLNPLKSITLNEAHRYLLSLPGIGEKYSRCVLMYSLGHDISPMDSHAIRIFKRQGLAPERSRPNEIHRLMDKLLPKGYSLRLHVNLVAHGRSICTTRLPKCEECSIGTSCKTFKGRTNSFFVV